MGIRIVDEVLDHTPWLPPAEKVLLIALAQRANDITRECWPGREELMHRLGTTDKDTLRRALGRLEALLAEHLDLDPEAKDVLRVSLGTDRNGRKVYAARGHRTTYRIPTLATKGACDRGEATPPFGVDRGTVAPPFGEEREASVPPNDPQREALVPTNDTQREAFEPSYDAKGRRLSRQREAPAPPLTFNEPSQSKDEPSKSSSPPSSYISPTGGDPLAALGLTRMEIEATSDVIRSAMGERPIRSWSALIAKLIANGDIQEYIRTARQVMAVNVPAYRKAHDWERRATFDDITCKWCGLPPEHACHRLTAVELAELAASVPLHALPKPALDLSHPTGPQSPTDEPLEPSDAPRNRSLPPEVAALLNGKRMD